MKTNIYFDNAATTAVDSEVLKEMTDYFSNVYGNPSSVYDVALNSKKAIEEAREKVAHIINAEPSCIYFTGGGSEADNWAVKGIAEAYETKGKHIITSCIEHHAVLHSMEYLEKKGFEVTYLPVDEDGLIDLKALENAIRKDTILISIMFANNEIGTIMPVKEIGELARKYKVIFHTDAVQAVGHTKVDVEEMNIDMLSMSAHKMYGPKGVGALYVKKGIKLPPLIHGGGQERGKRAGTENVAGIVGFGKAVQLIENEMESEMTRLTELRDYAIKKILDIIPYSRLNGHSEKRLPGNINISFQFIEGEAMLLFLSNEGFGASSGSACTSGSLDPSHVLLAIGLPHEKAHGSLRISLGKFNNKEEIEELLKVLPPIVKKLRDMSPLFEDFINNGFEYTV